MKKQSTKMVIYLCGGVGSGKSAVLEYLKQEFEAEVLETDKLAHELMKKGDIGYQVYLNLLGNDILDKDNELNRSKISEILFTDKEMLLKINAVFHPIVWDRVEEKIRSFFEDTSFCENAKGEMCQGNLKSSFLVIESALLPDDLTIQNLVDYRIYLYSPMELRIKRLKKSRGYSEEKVHSIIASQPSHEEYMQFCDMVIENDTEIEKLHKTLDIAFCAMGGSKHLQERERQ